MSVSGPLFLHDSCAVVVFFNYLHLLYKSGKHWANIHWISSQTAGSRCRISIIFLITYFIIAYSNMTHKRPPGHCSPIYIHRQGSTHEQSRITDKPNLIVTDYQVKLNVALLSVSDHFSWSLHFPSLLLFFVLHKKSAFCTLSTVERSIFNTRQCIWNHWSIL